MLNFFKSNSPGVIVFYVFYLVAFRIFIFFQPVNIHLFAGHSEPLSQVTAVVLTTLHANGPFTGLILSGLLCFIQSLLINKVVNDNKISPRKNYLAGLLYIIVFSFFKESLFLGPASLALTFVILSVIRVFALMRKEKASGDIFDVGFLIAIASLFYFPCIILVVFVFFAIATVRPFELKEWIVALTGFLTPFFITLTWYFWQDQTGAFICNIANRQPEKWLTNAAIGHVDAIVLGGILAFILAALAVLPTALYSSLIQVRKYSTILVFMGVLIAISFTLQQTASLAHWGMLAPPLSIIFSITLMQIRNKLIVEVVHLMLILLVLTGQYLPQLNII